MKSEKIIEEREVKEIEIFMDHRNQDQQCPSAKEEYVRKRQALQREINDIKRVLMYL